MLQSGKAQEAENKETSSGKSGKASYLSEVVEDK